MSSTAKVTVCTQDDNAARVQEFALNLTLNLTSQSHTISTSSLGLTNPHVWFSISGQEKDMFYLFLVPFYEGLK